MPRVRATFSWSPTPNADGYRLYHGDDPIGTYASPGAVAELEIPYGPVVFGVEAFNQTGFGPRRTIVRRLERPSPGEVEGFDVSMLIISSAGSGGGGGGESGYTATHYVAPYASVSGATSDEDVLNGTSYSSATSISTPCTLGEAMANASEGHRVQCAPGTYVGAEAGGSLPLWHPANSGTAGNEIVFFAQYPAAENYGSTELYSVLQKTGSDLSMSSPDEATMGATNRSYVIFDGFYADEENCYSGPSAGIFGASDSDFIFFRRLVVDRYAPGYLNGHNGNCWWGQDARDCIVEDCMFLGATDAGSHNQCAVQTNGCPRTVFRNNTITGGVHGIFIKGGGNIGNNHSPDIEIYNNFIDCSNTCIELYEYQDIVIHHNLIRGSGNHPFRHVCIDTSYISQASIYQNTLIGYGAGGPQIYDAEGQQNWDGTDIHSNIIYNAATGSARLAYIGVTNDDISALTRLDNNVYFDSQGSPEWRDNSLSTTESSLELWADHLLTNYGTAYEANSIYEDPEFTNYAGGDYSLASNSQGALTAAVGGGIAGAYDGTGEVGVRASPTY